MTNSYSYILNTFQGCITGSGFSSFEGSVSVLIECPNELHLIPTCQSVASATNLGEIRVVTVKILNVSDTEICVDMSRIGDSRVPHKVNVKVSLAFPESASEIQRFVLNLILPFKQ